MATMVSSRLTVGSSNCTCFCRSAERLCAALTDCSAVLKAPGNPASWPTAWLASCGAAARGARPGRGRGGGGAGGGGGGGKGGGGKVHGGIPVGSGDINGDMTAYPGARHGAGCRELMAIRALYPASRAAA